VKDSDATLIFTPGKPTGGSKKTAQFAEKHAKPYLIIDSLNEENANVAEIIRWLHNIQNSDEGNPITEGGCVLNVAGSRGSKAPELQEYVKNVMISVIRAVNNLEEFSEKSGDEQVELIALPFYPELKVACGVFRDGTSEFEAETIEIPNPHSNFDPGKHFVVRAIGDSMDGGPTPVKDGELLILEINRGGTISNQIFAVEYCDDSGNVSYILKRVEKEADGSYVLISQNRNYKPIPVNPENMFPFARLKKIVKQDR
jgi:SOS-response transcriptional repressor LexA